MGIKKTFTYATDPMVKEKAARRAKKEKLTLSEAIDRLLRDYIAVDKNKLDVLQEKADKWDSLDREIGDVYLGSPETDLEDVGRFIIDKFGY